MTSPRYELENACVMKGWSDADLAARLHPKVNTETVRRWRTGEQTPYKHYITQICTLFEVKHPRELNLDAQFNASTTRCREDEILAMLANYDRRQLLDLFSKLPVLAGIDLTVLFSTTVVAPEKLLNVSRTVVEQCWNLIDRNGGTIADVLLSACMPELESLATHLSEYRHDAALLAVEATIIQMIIATQTMNYASRAQLGLEAVRFGKMSGDGNLHALALGWHGDTYNHCYHQPRTAIAHLNDALKCGNDVSLLNKTDIYISLATTHALEKSATKAREYAELAHMTMPENHKSDPLYRLIELGQSELDRREGDMYLILTEHFPAKRFPEEAYAQKAYAAFDKSTKAQAIDQRNLGYALIHKAEAACDIKNMADYFTCLEEGERIARRIRGDRLIADAVTALQKAPSQWRNEQRYRELRKILTPNIVIAHQ